MAYIFTGVEVRSFGAALIAAFVIGLLNTVVRPVLAVRTLPVGAALLGSLIYSAVGLVIESALERLFPKK